MAGLERSGRRFFGGDPVRHAASCVRGDAQRHRGLGGGPAPRNSNGPSAGHGRIAYGDHGWRRHAADCDRWICSQASDSRRGQRVGGDCGGDVFCHRALGRSRGRLLVACPARAVGPRWLGRRALERWPDDGTLAGAGPDSGHLSQWRDDRLRNAHWSGPPHGGSLFIFTLAACGGCGGPAGSLAATRRNFRLPVCGGCGDLRHTLGRSRRLSGYSLASETAHKPHALAVHRLPPRRGRPARRIVRPARCVYGSPGRSATNGGDQSHRFVGRSRNNFSCMPFKCLWRSFRGFRGGWSRCWG